MTTSAPPRGPGFCWYVCGLLLLATTINYMDRQTLASAADRVKTDLNLSSERYGDLETYFGVAFAAGSLLFGFLADRVSVRWLYPGTLLAWSAVSVATGSARNFHELLLCRTLLGLFEAGHWPCALRTTQQLLTPRERGLGNSLLQVGASVGAIITPLALRGLLTPETGSWRAALQIIGAVGAFWAVLWLPAVRASDLTSAPEPVRPQSMEAPAPASLWRRLVVLLVVVVTINVCWQLFRAWLPLFLQRGRGYTEADTLDFTSAYYLAAGVGCTVSGWASLALHRRGLSVGAARRLVFTVCAALTALSVGVALTPRGELLLAQLLLLAAGSLGLFPCYYSLSQEISRRHMGKVAGLFAMAAWLISAPVHKYFGRYIDRTGSYDLGVALAGCLPLVAAVVWWLLWDGEDQR